MPRHSPYRKYRVADQLQQEIAHVLSTEIQSSHKGLISITAVEVSSDYAYAKVYFSVMNADHEATQDWLNSQAARIQQSIYKRIRLFHSPVLSFMFDHTPEQAEHINRLLIAAQKNTKAQA